jgi:hypothetical protein
MQPRGILTPPVSANEALGSSFMSIVNKHVSNIHEQDIMRQRITYIQKPDNSLDPSTLEVGKASIKTNGLKAAREEKITFGFDELPNELKEVLKESYEVHIRWVSEKAYETRAPLVSRLTSGLHVFYTPQRGNNAS